ncbi:NADP-dependent oxidoreductase [Nonomuraea endophytica]|uniref:NADPH:quinone reductase-like Zn-dependent oxidoreductase n=1 Tax=Nonomuraea endophytica TaxID=714136 RepID=A0A7W8ACQ9_9ACTN|nr:NADP-dependent oxidoreductase [Nonomuraea endophytica]MBB5082353.1 NADPH:quinone reductase-like Zn-dependent oxidoreductase [Nonomuraea endophytica]
MRTIVYRSFGGPEVLEPAEVDRPVPEPNEVLVKVHAVGVNPPDWKLRRGPYPPRWVTPPLVPGFDVSGVVEASGAYQGRFVPGDEVFGMILFPNPANAYSEYVVARPRQFARKPEGLSHVEAAALPMSGLTAWQGFEDSWDVRPGRRLLVHGAAGGVGHLVVQLAKQRGAYVIGTASAGKHDFVRRMGADEVIDYRAGDFARAVEPVDAVFDIVGGDYPERSLPLVKAGGAYLGAADISDEVGARYTARGVRWRRFQVEPDHASLAELAKVLNVHVDRTFPLEEAAKAHELAQSADFVGKIVLEV